MTNTTLIMTVMTDEYMRILKEDRLKRIRTAREFTGAKRGSGKHLHYLGALSMPDTVIYYVYSLDDEATRDQITGYQCPSGSIPGTISPDGISPAARSPE